MPSVARPQLKAVESSGASRLLKAELETKIAPRNSQIGPATSQKKRSSSAVSPVAEKAATTSGERSHSRAVTAAV